MGLDFSQGGYEDLFKLALTQGLTLFCGAGFSIEALDNNNLRLPLGGQLLNELKHEFSSINNYTNLPRACTKIIKTDKQTFYSFLKKRFAVKDFSSEYMALTKINVKSIYTTNIDDLFFKIYDCAEKPLYLNDCSIKGSSYNDELAVHYYPLHGCIRNPGDYVFGATEIASVFSQRGNEKAWKNLAVDASQHPILFWGWNFEDSGPIEAMYNDNHNIDNNTNRWVLLLPNSSPETIDYIESLGFNIILGDTGSMLHYINDFVNSICEEEPISRSNDEDNASFRYYMIPPNDENLTSYPLSKYFIEYTPHWSHIYSNIIPKTTNYKKVENSIASGKDTLVMGIRSSGKTTIMMQLLANYKTQKFKHMLIAPSIEQVKTYLKILNGRDSILFVDDCFRDTYAILQLLKVSNVQLIGFDRDFNYERQYHQIQGYSFTPIDITEITQEDAQSIINIIPEELKREDTGTKYFQKDPTILSLLAKNLKAVNFNFLQTFINNDLIAAKLFTMISYVHACGTPCSFDMIYSFLGDESYTWKEMYGIIENIGGLVKDASEWLSQLDVPTSLEDYYQCRSRFLAEKIISSIPRGNKVFANVLTEFTKYVPAYKICQYDKFKRSAYDADFATRAFPNINDGCTFYEMCIDKDESEYIYQQAAIYFSRLGDYKKAFTWIENARNLAHYNRFSIDSTYAKIYFDVNLSVDEEQARVALDILKGCCENDKRKSIHFAAFARRCIDYHKTYGGDDYIYLAQNYLKEGLDDKNLSLSKKNKIELRNLQDELNRAY